MSVMINVQPGSATFVRVVQNSVEPPMLLIYDGTATVFFSPAEVRGGMVYAHEFAGKLARAAADWEQGCLRAKAAAQSADPLRIGEVIAEHGNPDQGSG